MLGSSGRPPPPQTVAGELCWRDVGPEIVSETVVRRPSVPGENRGRKEKNRGKLAPDVSENLLRIKCRFAGAITLHKARIRAERWRRSGGEDDADDCLERRRTRLAGWPHSAFGTGLANGRDGGSGPVRSAAGSSNPPDGAGCADSNRPGAMLAAWPDQDGRGLSGGVARVAGAGGLRGHADRVGSKAAAGIAAGPLRDSRRNGTRRDGDSVPGVRQTAGTRRGAQDTQLRSAPGTGGGRAVPARRESSRPDPASQRLSHLRCRMYRGNLFLGDGADRGRLPGPLDARSPAVAGGSGPTDPPPRTCAAGGPRARDCASRHQAFERDGHAAGRTAVDGFWPRAATGRPRRLDLAWRTGGDGSLHVPRAGQWRAGRPSQRCVQSGCRPVSTADRRASVSRHPDRHPVGHWLCPAGEAQPFAAGGEFGSGERVLAGDGQEAGGAVSVGGRTGDGTRSLLDSAHRRCPAGSAAAGRRPMGHTHGGGGSGHPVRRLEFPRQGRAVRIWWPSRCP